MQVVGLASASQKLTPLHALFFQKEGITIHQVLSNNLVICTMAMLTSNLLLHAELHAYSSSEDNPLV